MTDAMLDGERRWARRAAAVVPTSEPADRPRARPPTKKGTAMTARTTDARPAADVDRYRRLALIVTIAGAFMVALDTTVVNIAVATLADEFAADVTRVQWVLTGYLLALGVAIPGAGYLADRFGSKRLYLATLLAFTLASAACAVAPNLDALVLARVLQGLGGGAVQPLAFAIALRVIPVEQRGKYIGFLAVPILLAPALGPIVGGYLVESFSWRWIFAINLPIGAVVAVAAWRWLREEKLPATGRFDLAGLVLAGVGFAALLYAVSEAPSRGWTAPPTLLLAAAGLLLLAAFVAVELRHPAPLLDVRLFADPAFALGNAVIWLAAVGLFGGLLLLPLFLQQVQGISPLAAGLVLLPQGLGLVLASPLSGVLYDRGGARWPVAGGMLGTAATTALLARIGPDTGAWALAPLLLARGAAIALVFNPAQTAALASVGHAEAARASSMVNALRQIAAALGVAATATLLRERGDAGRPPEQAYQEVFLITAVALLPAVAAALLLPRGRPVVGTEESAGHATAATVLATEGRR
jgi:EmrB/QacA subfamily drug resistance transporter